MKFKEYFLLTQITTKSLLTITSIIFGVIFMIFAFAMKIKDPSSTDIGQIQMMLVRFSFVYGLTIWIFICAIISAYRKANNTIKLYNSTSLDIKDKFCLLLQPKQLNIKYNYLDFEILGLYNDQVFYVDKFEKNVRIILAIAFSHNTNIMKLQAEFDKKYRKYGININGYGLVKKIKEIEWKRISVAIIEEFIEKMKSIEEREKYTPILVNN